MMSARQILQSILAFSGQKFMKFSEDQKQVHHRKNMSAPFGKGSDHFLMMAKIFGGAYHQNLTLAKLEQM